MDRKEFLSRLETLLADISEDDRNDALDYYRCYLDEAGENEEQVLEKLGSPEELAALIRSGLKEGAAQGGDFTDSGYTEYGCGKQKYEITGERAGKKEEKNGGETFKKSEKARAEKERDDYVKGSYADERKKDRKMTGGKLALCIVGVIILWPFALGLLGVGLAGIGTLVGGIFSLILTLAGLLLSVGVLTVGLLLGGAAVSVLSLAGIAAQPALGFLFLGIGLFMTGAGLIVLIAAVLFYGTFLPWLFKKGREWIGSLKKQQKGRQSDKEERG
ncbi:DUF1700 domain-containing protein [Clostridium sp. AM29-11AC]|mgnify:CR=1 FL=1|nr:DUF1700 domain-containing protein [Clostridium sp. AM29-11AC]